MHHRPRSWWCSMHEEGHRFEALPLTARADGSGGADGERLLIRQSGGALVVQEAL